MNRGFTVVEILITLVVMTVLLTLGVFAVRGSLVNARDAERAEDIAAIARGLEIYYKRGNPYYIGGGTTKGTYPGANSIIGITGAGWCDSAYFKNAAQAALYSVCKNYTIDALPGTTLAALIPPNYTSQQLANPWLTTDSGRGDQLINTAMMNDLDAGKYVYKPMESSNLGLCYSHGSDPDAKASDGTPAPIRPCTRFVLLYKKESTGEIVQTWSKHQ